MGSPARGGGSPGGGGVSGGGGARGPPALPRGEGTARLSPRDRPPFPHRAGLPFPHRTTLPRPPFPHRTALHRTALLPLDHPSPPGPPFPCTAQNFVLFFPLWGLLVEFWWFLKRHGAQMCTFGLLGCRVKPTQSVFLHSCLSARFGERCFQQRKRAEW